MYILVLHILVLLVIPYIYTTNEYSAASTLQAKGTLYGIMEILPSPPNKKLKKKPDKQTNKKGKGKEGRKTKWKKKNFIEAFQCSQVSID